MRGGGFFSSCGLDLPYIHCSMTHFHVYSSKSYCPIPYVTDWASYWIDLSVTAGDVGESLDGYQVW